MRCTAAACLDDQTVGIEQVFSHGRIDLAGTGASRRQPLRPIAAWVNCRDCVLLRVDVLQPQMVDMRTAFQSASAQGRTALVGLPARRVSAWPSGIRTLFREPAAGLRPAVPA